MRKRGTHRLRSIFTASLFSGELPDGWELVPIGNVLTSTEYGLSEPGDASGNTRIVGMRDIQDGIVNLQNLAMVDDGGADWTSMRLRKGDILLNRTNSPDLVGKVAIVREDSDAVFASYLVRLHVDHKKVSPEFVNYWLNSPIAQRALKRLATRAVSQANINPTEFRRYCPMPLPPFREQAKITEILASCDLAGERLTQLIISKRRRLRGLYQHFLQTDGTYPRGWRVKNLIEVSTRIRRQNGGNNHPVMTISAKSGFLIQSDKFSRDMAGRSVERYILLQNGEFAYNKGNSLTAPYGCIFALDRPTALVPFVYFCFRMHDDLNRDFYSHLFASGALNHQLSRLINSGVRNDGLLNLDADEFFGCKIPVPPPDEQARIAAALTSAKAEIELLDRQLTAVRSQKRGLMQKLLTGEWRVKVAT